MPIRGLTDRGVAFPQIGNIRKGEPKGENQPGKDLHWFRVELDQSEEQAAKDFAALYGDKPNGIVVIMPFDDIARVWDAWREAYTAGAMNHRCDGENVVYAINPKSGEIVVRNGVDVVTGQPVECGLKDSPDKTKRCKPTGRLSVVIPQLRRLAYLTLHTTSIHDILNISNQLQAIRDLNDGHIAGIPLVLSRKPYKISTPSGKDGQRARREKWLISIEADPTWVAAKIEQMRAFALPAPAAQQIIDAPRSGGPNLADLSDYDEDDEDAAPTTPATSPATTEEQSDSQSPGNGQATRPAATPAPAPSLAPSAPSSQAKPAASNGRSASIRTPAWTTAATALNKKLVEAGIVYYQGKDGKPNLYHMAGSAAKCGYSEVTETNLVSVISDLEQHAREQSEAVPF